MTALHALFAGSRALESLSGGVAALGPAVATAADSAAGAVAVILDQLGVSVREYIRETFFVIGALTRWSAVTLVVLFLVERAFRFTRGWPAGEIAEFGVSARSRSNSEGDVFLHRAIHFQTHRVRWRPRLSIRTGCRDKW